MLLTVTCWVTAHPLGTVYVIKGVPDETPFVFAVPDPGPPVAVIDAWNELLELNIPPVVPLATGIELPVHTANVVAVIGSGVLNTVIGNKL